MSVFSTFCCGKIIFKFIGPKQFSMHQEKLADVDLVARKFDYVCLSSHAEKALLHVEARGRLYQIKGV